MSPSSLRPDTIYVGVDGSEGDAQVAEVALDVARDLGAKLVLVRAIDRGADDDTATPATLAHVALAERVHERTREAERLLESLRSRLVARAGGSVAVEARLVDGHPFEALIEAAAAGASTWIAVGARRTTRVLGRTVDLVLRRASRPVLVVPDAGSWGAGPVLAAIDAGELDGAVLGVADGLARTLSRRLGITHVRTSGDDSAMLRVTEHTREVAAGIAASATISVMRVERSIAQTLADHARRTGTALLVVGTHGRRGVERWVLGSTAEALVHESPVPFLVVRAP